jgi:tRNA nucleotidyltransferase (CCA-adding enzyme)
LGIAPHDYDIATSALPNQTKALFHNLKIVETGLKHGTLTLIWEGNEIEVTVFRRDGEYTDNRRPDSVTFTDDFTLDAQRRDFTVNAMGYSPATGLSDPCGGKADLEKGLIRAVGDPATRFREDGLRIMRALRFASQLGFEIEEGTESALFE